jgi:hypothetical protein
LGRGRPWLFLNYFGGIDDLTIYLRGLIQLSFALTSNDLHWMNYAFETFGRPTVDPEIYGK